MSYLAGRPRRGMLGWMSPRGVAPKRMPKAEATGLAPLLIGKPRTLEIELGGFCICASGW